MGGGKHGAQSDPPVTDAARQWEGWGTSLKPALEPITVARKPMSSTVAANVLAHGTGALNIDGCRVGERWPANLLHDGSDEVLAGFPESGGSGPARKLNRGERTAEAGWGMGDQEGDPRDAGTGSAARFFYCAKASKKDRNSGLDSIVEVTIEWSQSLESHKWEKEARKVRLLVDTEQLHPRVIGAFGAQNNDATAWSTMLFGSVTTGQSQQGSTCTTRTKTNCTTPLEILSLCQSSITSASTQAASSEMASCGSLAETAEQSSLLITTTNGRMALALGAEHAALPMRLKISASAARSGHPTVKPTDLMAYLCRLVTPPGGIVLDPFMGSGSTGKAAMREGFKFIGCELSEEYMQIAKARIQNELDKRFADLF